MCGGVPSHSLFNQADPRRPKATTCGRLRSRSRFQPGDATAGCGADAGGPERKPGSPGTPARWRGEACSVHTHEAKRLFQPRLPGHSAHTPPAPRARRRPHGRGHTCPRPRRPAPDHLMSCVPWRPPPDLPSGSPSGVAPPSCPSADAPWSCHPEGRGLGRGLRGPAGSGHPGFPPAEGPSATRRLCWAPAPCSQGCAGPGPLPEEAGGLRTAPVEDPVPTPGREVGRWKGHSEGGRNHYGGPLLSNECSPGHIRESATTVLLLQVGKLRHGAGWGEAVLKAEPGALVPCSVLELVFLTPLAPSAFFFTRMSLPLCGD